ncbi:unnamed protein product [Ranitomeya imitator]|uniref:Uncharacterized protein n=1 Tax=Ranitomeya imitator TaxID=111125 RepID=A0ABN9KTU1_9NEOB|nr:unnamed protein product [Ranitomeya imitator]
MFPAPPFLLILTLTLTHAPLFHAIPVTEEQRHQTTHRTLHSEVAHPTELEDHQDSQPPVQSQHVRSEATQERSTNDVQSPSSSDDEDELFKDISPKALAAVLLKALNPDDGEQTPTTVFEKVPPTGQVLVKEEMRKVDEEDQTERVRSRTRSSDKEETIKEDEKMDDGEDMESVKSLLQELEAFEPPAKKELDPLQDSSLEREDLQKLRELLGFGEQTEEEKRSPLNSVPHTSQQLDEEEEEEDEKLANVAQDLLLQYLLNGSENDDEEAEEDEKENEQDYPVDDFVGGQRPLFEDEEEGNTQSKRSNDDDIEEVDPQTIDKLIELSSRLHLPADDVVDIINDVEKRKRRRMKKKKARDDFLGRRERIRNPPQSWPDTAYYPRRKLDQQSSWNKVDTTWKKSSTPSWNRNRLSESTWKKLSNPIWTKPSKSNWNKISDPSLNRVSEPSWNKVSQPSWNKVSEPSWNKVSQPSWNKVSEPSWNKLSEPSWNKVSEPNWNKVSQSSWNKVSQPSWNKISEPSWNKVSEPSWNKISEPSWNENPKAGWNKVPESSWNEVSKPSWDKVSEPSWKVSEPSWNKVSETNWNKVSEPNWSNVPDTKWNKMQESSWNKASQPRWMKAMDPYTRRYRARPAPYTNYILPRTFQNPPRYYYKPPVPQPNDYFDDDQDKQEEMENYIERILLNHPEVFQ